MGKKIDKSRYSKRQWKLIKEFRKNQKAVGKKKDKPLPDDIDVFDPNYQKTVDEFIASLENPVVANESASVTERPKRKLEPITKPDDEKMYILCVKQGVKYNHEYVNRLYRMVKRHCTLDFEMVCITDDNRNIDPEIKIIDLPSGLVGWWSKVYMFNKDLPLNGTILYLDLDVVIANNIDHLFTYKSDKWCIIRDFTRAMRPKWQRYNSSVIRFKSGQLDSVWKRFKDQKQVIMRRFHGDQDLIWDTDKSATLWPDRWILSWKWEVRKSRIFEPGGTKGNRKLRGVETVEPPKDCAICVFHGDPNPDNCDDPWVKKNWT